MRLSELVTITQDMWGREPEVFNTKVEGIYDTRTAGHGGYLVDTRLHPELKNYGADTRNSNIRAFEEDYEALKVLWLYPQLINNSERANEWLNEKTVVRYEPNSNFLNEFPNRKLLDNDKSIEEEEANEL